MVLAEISLGWLSDIRSLTCTNILATILIAYGLVAVLSLAIHQGWEQDPDAEERQFVCHWKRLPPVTDAWFLFVGTSFFIMEGGITVVVPLQEAVGRLETVSCRQCAHDMGHYGLSYLLCVYLCRCFGRRKFKNRTDVICRALLGEQTSWWWRGVLTTVITFILDVIATLAIDYLGNVVSLLGSMFGIPLALVFPPLMHNRLVGDRVQMNYVVVCFGLLAKGAASYATVASWNQEGG
ncbi:hypothetical protein FisN_6Lu028 [Fistulifera solaris]|uniref:Amino acid transporter transmembrane domain-containing protein n=1 Tax=Fistulifera solaris TaxID=1519565 RepID=A0A1Z5KP92_FISSO|nr:hypothetical protein FisN_6Lu028 [Fistulifera solaris]|eukprot:GAX28150.1 hypothetical protein FisN_6Lu028 [Fistulifera solaris]